MKCLYRITYLHLVFLFFFISNSHSQQKKRFGVDENKGFTIDGHIEGLQEGGKAFIVMSTGDGRTDEILIDSAIINKNSFHLSGFAPEGPRMFTLKFEKHSNKACILILNNNEKVIIKGGDINTSPELLQNWVTIEGSPSNYSMRAFHAAYLTYQQSIGQIDRELRIIKDSIGFSPLLVEGLMIAKRKIDDAFYFVPLRDNPAAYKPSVKSTIGFWLHEIGLVMQGHPYYLPLVYNEMSAEEKNSFYGKYLKESAALAVGQPFPEFSLPDREGKLVALRDINTKNKITLVQFWASNSYDVENSQMELQVLFKKYNNKGLNIIGVSCDTSARRWKLAASELPWYHVSDLKGKKGVVGEVYHEAGNQIPNTTNVLIDDKGKIIAWDVNGVELQWYIWKALGD